MIRIMPSVGDTILINAVYFDHNILFSQYFESLKPATPYFIESLAFLEGDSTVWGIDKLKDAETGEIIDISTVPELSGFWCLLDANDSYRVIPTD